MIQNYVLGIIEVVWVGLLLIVQDFGCCGMCYFGVVQGGVFDGFVFEVGNWFVGNCFDVVVVEIMIGFVMFCFMCVMCIVIIGIEFGVMFDGKFVYLWWSLLVVVGQMFVLLVVKCGMCGYLCIVGGIDVLLMFGLCSIDFVLCFGGFGGCMVCDGDWFLVGVLLVGVGCFVVDVFEFGVKVLVWCVFVCVDELLCCYCFVYVLWVMFVCVLLGFDYVLFVVDLQQVFWDEEWFVIVNSNWMGYWFVGVEFVCVCLVELLLYVVLFGMIQVLLNGQLIVLMYDVQIIGGYLKIGMVICVDLWKFVQVWFNLLICFVCMMFDVVCVVFIVEWVYLWQIDVVIEMCEEVCCCV